MADGIPAVPLATSRTDGLVGGQGARLRLLLPGAGGVARCTTAADNALQPDVIVVGVANLLGWFALVVDSTSIHIELYRWEPHHSLCTDGGGAGDNHVQIFVRVSVEERWTDGERPATVVVTLVEVEPIHTTDIAHNLCAAGHTGLHTIGLAQRIQGDGECAGAYPIVLCCCYDCCHKSIFIFLCAKIR